MRKGGGEGCKLKIEGSEEKVILLLVELFWTANCHFCPLKKATNIAFNVCWSTPKVKAHLSLKS